LAIGCVLFAVGCGSSSSSSSSDDDSQADDDDDASPAADDDDNDDASPDNTPPPGCDGKLVAGLNKIAVNGVVREYYLDLPSDVNEKWPWPIVFNWHGFGDTAAHMRTLINEYVNYEGFHFIEITPEDSGMILDWDIINGTNPENREVMLFDALVAKIDQCWGVDKKRIYTMGFSFGGGVSDLLGVTRGDTLAAIATCSGVYASDPANVIPYAVAKWPVLSDIANKYVELRLHGGVLDNMVLPFGQYGVNDVIYLNQNHHDAVECLHPGTHNEGFLYMSPEDFIEFLRDHPLGTTVSPYKDGFPAGYYDQCTYKPKD
jgi:hypothetical protein